MRETWIVSGGVGALGSAIVRAALTDGHRVVVPWIFERQRTRLADEQTRAVDDGQLVLTEADVAGEDGAARVAASAGTPHVLVNAAGGFAGGDPVAATDLATWDRLYRTNLRTAVALARAVVPAMQAEGRGLVVNVSASAIDAPPAGLAAYVASKAGVAVLTQALQAELADRGVRVNALLPTTIDTPANREAMPDADRSRWTQPDAIADVVRWLASPAGHAVRGALIPV